jgi:hypothetical protein
LGNLPSTAYAINSPHDALEGGVGVDDGVVRLVEVGDDDGVAASSESLLARPCFILPDILVLFSVQPKDAA